MNSITATTKEGGEDAILRIARYLGEWPTTSQWRKYSKALNITTGPSDVGNRDGYTFSEIRSECRSEYDLESLDSVELHDESKVKRRANGGSSRSSSRSLCLPNGVKLDFEDAEVDSYRHTADWHVYVLELEDESGEMWYYVGETESLSRRLIQHQDKMGNFSHSKNFISVGVYAVKSYSESDEIVSLEDFIKNKEREVMLNLARSKDTNNVLGGR